MFYSLGVAAVQFLLPSGVLSLVHARIYFTLSSVRQLNQQFFTTIFVQLPFWSQSQQRSSSSSGQQAESRGQKTVYLLIIVVVVFMCSWLPLNLINILNDVGYLDTIIQSPVTYRLVFSICHLIGMTSALTNPLFYGYFNEVCQMRHLMKGWINI